jgi:hypothetical protein
MMTGWLSESFDEHTVLWLLISTVLGGVVGSGITFVYEDVLRPWLSFRRDTSRLVKMYTTPLVRATESLERRLENFSANDGSAWYRDDEYYRMSTLFVFAEYLGLIRTLEREFGFVPLESEERGRRLQQRLSGLFRSLTSFAYFSGAADPARVEESSVPRFLLRAIGEAVSDSNNPRRTMEFTDFVLRYGSDPQFRRWFAELDAFLRSASRRDDTRRQRVVATQANLRALLLELDPRGALVKPHRWDRLLDRLDADDPVRIQLVTEFGAVAERARRVAEEIEKPRRARTP